jgi:hypothetical protein
VQRGGDGVRVGHGHRDSAHRVVTSRRGQAERASDGLPGTSHLLLTLRRACNPGQLENGPQDVFQRTPIAPYDHAEPGRDACRDLAQVLRRRPTAENDRHPVPQQISQVHADPAIERDVLSQTLRDGMSGRGVTMMARHDTLTRISHFAASSPFSTEPSSTWLSFVSKSRLPATFEGGALSVGNELVYRLLVQAHPQANPDRNYASHIEQRYAP